VEEKEQIKKSSNAKEQKTQNPNISDNNRRPKVPNSDIPSFNSSSP